MSLCLRLLVVPAAAAGLFGLVFASGSPGQNPPAQPRPGLSAQQTKQAVELTRSALRELRRKTEGASDPEADQREYIVNVELLAARDAPPAQKKSQAQANAEEKSPAQATPAEQAGGLRAAVTSYRYFDDITVFAIVDLETGRVVDLEAMQHLRTPLSEGEFEEAKALARARSEETRKLFDQYGDRVTVYPQFSQYTVKGDRRIHRVVHLNFRVDRHDLSYPRPQVDLTTREVQTPPPEAEPKVRPRRR